MKILFVVGATAPHRLHQATTRLSIMKKLPCEVFVVYRPGHAAEHIMDVDIVLLDHMSYRICSLGSYESMLKQFQGLVGGFYGDIWNPNHRFPSGWLDMGFVSFMEPLKHNFPLMDLGGIRLEDLYFVPACVDVYDSTTPRDIDVLVWGAVSTPYPFRMFYMEELGKLTTTKRVDPFPDFNKLIVNGHQYKFAHLDLSFARHQGYYKPKLFDLLQRVKVSCCGPVEPLQILDPLRYSRQGARSTGPWPHGGIVVGKYFENAAAGVVTLSSKFSDMGALGFKHGENVWITDKQHFRDDLAYLLENDDVRERISENAKHLIRTRHTVEIRAHEFHALLSSKLEESVTGAGVDSIAAGGSS